MTQEQIIENNKLIAEFMELKPVELLEGWEKYDKQKRGQAFNIPEHEIQLSYHETKIDFCCDGMSYKYSWDWLMPVVEKISKIDSYVTTKETMKNIGLAIPDLKLVYEYVCEFIKWYNENKPA